MSYKKEFVCNRKKIFVNINSDADESVFNEIFIEREYKVLEPILLKAARPVFDIGAHVGMFSIYVRCFNLDVPIFAYEPDEKNFAAMKENFSENGVKNVIMKNVAVAKEVNMREFFISSDSHNHSLIEIGNSIGSKKVQAVSLEKIFMQNNFQKVGLVKMDVEGAEFEILESLNSEIFGRVENFYIEYHEYVEGMKGGRLKEILLREGFKVEMKPSFYDERMGFIWAKR